MSVNGSVEECQNNILITHVVNTAPYFGTARLLLMGGTSELPVEDVILGEESTNILFVCYMNNIRFTSYR